MLRVITDPEPDLQPTTTEAAEHGLGELVRGVLGLVWIIGPVAPRTVGRSDATAARIELVGGSAELVLDLRNDQAAAAPLLLVIPPLRAADGRVAGVYADPRSVVVPPRETRRLVVQLRVEPETPAGVYETEIRLLGADEAVVPIVVEVDA